MRKTGKWLLSIVARVVVIILVILMLPYARNLYHLIIPDATGEIRTQSKILEQKLESSQRLEVTTIDEEGILTADTNVIIFGTVGTTRIKYRYTASIVIDLSKVIMTVDSDRIIFTLPETEILNDGIEALEINKNNLFSKAIEKSTETLLAEQRIRCREHYITDEQYSLKTRDDTVKAFNDTICQWLESYGERHCEFEIICPDKQAAE